MAVVVLGTDKGVFLLRGDPARKTWSLEGPLFKGWRATAAARSKNGRWYLGLASEVWGAAIHTSDDLKHWRQIENGPAYPSGGDRRLEQIWRITAAGDRLYAGVADAGLFRSDDDGASWQPLPGLNEHPTRSAWQPGGGGLCAHSIVVDPKHPERMWCGISSVGVFRSDDDGDSWTTMNDGVKVIIEDEKIKDVGFCVHALALDPDDASRIYRQDHTGMYRSENAGGRWEHCQNGLPSTFGFPLVVDPRTGALFCFPQESDEYRIAPGGHFRVYCSRDRGDSWEALSRGLPPEGAFAGVLRGAMAVDGLDPCGVYVGSTSGSLHVSNDCGESWTTLPYLLPRIFCVEAFGEA
jgi:hypothetical protein